MLTVNLNVDIKLEVTTKAYLFRAGDVVLVDIGNGIAFDAKSGMYFDIFRDEYSILN